MHDIIGAPVWANMDGFDIQAKAADSNRGQVSLQQMRLMVQSLLADRFQLMAHWEVRETAVCDLVVVKDGAKLKTSDDNGPHKQQLVGMPPSPSGAMSLKLTYSAMSLSDLATFLQGYVGRSVKDKTNLNGLFDVALQFVLEPLSPTPAAGAPSVSDPSGPTIFTALQEQLGLKLESVRGPVEMARD